MKNSHKGQGVASPPLKISIKNKVKKVVKMIKMKIFDKASDKLIKVIECVNMQDYRKQLVEKVNHTKEYAFGFVQASKQKTC